MNQLRHGEGVCVYGLSSAVVSEYYASTRLFGEEGPSSRQQHPLMYEGGWVCGKESGHGTLMTADRQVRTILPTNPLYYTMP